RMARNTKRLSQQDENFDELEDVLSLDASDLLDAEADLDVSTSIEDLEAQISLAVEELTRENRVSSENPSDELEPESAELESAAEGDFSMSSDRDLGTTEPEEPEATGSAAAQAGNAETDLSRKEAVPVAPSSTPLSFDAAND